MANGPYYAEGNYRLKVTGQSLGESSTSLTPQFVLKAKVIGQYDDDEIVGVDQEYERYFYMYLTEKAIPYVIEQLAHLGFAGTSFRALDPTESGFHDFTGIEFDGFCKHERYQGSSREKWGMSLGKKEVKPMEKRKVMELDALFGKALKTGIAGALPRHTQSSAAVGTMPTAGHGKSDFVADDDSLPF